jgi:catechol 2,3-dioxygenase-like lactoylglutathione lyase family enzyme
MLRDGAKEVGMRPLHHIGYWVDDLDEAVDRAVRSLGVGPFLVHRNVRFDMFRLADGREITDPAYFDHTAAFASWGPVVLELGQVHTADPEIVAAYGIRTGAVGHVSWVVDDLAAETARLEGLGCRLIHTAALGAVRVAWHDGGPLFPHPIEVHLAGPPILGMAGRLAALAEGWDGSEPQQPMGP